jgi:hypothetical protein
MFNRADHVKKHFLRMHREHEYNLSKIRRSVGSNPPKPLHQDTSNAAAAAVAAVAVATATPSTSGQQQPQQQQHVNYQSNFVSNKNYQLQPNAAASSNGNGTMGIYQAPSMAAPGIMQPDNNVNAGRRVQNGNNKTYKSNKSSQERR